MLLLCLLHQEGLLTDALQAKYAGHCIFACTVHSIHVDAQSTCKARMLQMQLLP